MKLNSEVVYRGGNIGQAVLLCKVESSKIFNELLLVEQIDVLPSS